MYYLTLFLLIARTYGYPCGQCICTEWMSTLTCIGKDVTELPKLNNTQWVRHIDVLNTSMVSLSGLTQADWKELYTIDFRENCNIDCQLINDFRKNRADLMVLSDCYPTVIEDTIQSGSDWLSLLSIMPVIFSGVIIGYVRHRRSQMQKRNLRLNNTNATSTIVTLV